MKRFVISLALLSMGAIAFAPNALADMNRQSSDMSEESLTEFVRRNRDARSKN